MYDSEDKSSKNEYIEEEFREWEINFHIDGYELIILLMLYNLNHFAVIKLSIFGYLPCYTFLVIYIAFVLG